MQMGFNNDVPYKGLVVHIQTEDHGLRTMKITSQVFHSGAILDSKTISYENEIAELDADGPRDERIRHVMKALHKQHFKKIHAGVYDELLPLTDAAAEDAAPSSADAIAPEAAAEAAPEAELGLGVPTQMLEEAGIRVAGEMAAMQAEYDANSRGAPMDFGNVDDFEPMTSDAFIGSPPPTEPSPDEAIPTSDVRCWRGGPHDEEFAGFLLSSLGVQ